MSETIGVYDAVSVGVWATRDGYSLTVMHQVGPSDSPYGGKKEQRLPGDVVPQVLESDDLVMPNGEHPDFTQDSFSEAKTYWDEEDGGPWELTLEDSGVLKFSPYRP